MPPGKGRRNVEATPGPPDSVSTAEKHAPFALLLECELLLVLLHVAAVLTLCSALSEPLTLVAVTGRATASSAATSAVHLRQLR